MAPRSMGSVRVLRQSVPTPPSRGFEAIPHEWRNPESWPTADATGLSEDARVRFERLSRGIRHYLATGGELKGALEEAKCSKSVFYDQLARCVKPADGLGTIVGWEGLLWRKRLKIYSRVSGGGGYAGLFAKWLNDNPAWEHRLIHLIKRGGGGQKIASQSPSVRSVTAQFIKEIKASCRDNEYPRTTKSCARRSIERYVACYVKMNQATTSVWFGKDVAARQRKLTHQVDS